MTSVEINIQQESRIMPIYCCINSIINITLITENLSLFNNGFHLHHSAPYKTALDPTQCFLHSELEV